jgi:PadR family transcriptional regulator, regulatory protein PadR
MVDEERARLAAKEFIAMKLLVAASPKERYGLEIVELSDGQLKRGTVYVTLNRLEERGYISSRKEPEQPGIAQPRRLYKVTGLGVKVFQANEQSRASLREAFAS